MVKTLQKENIGTAVNYNPFKGLEIGDVVPCTQPQVEILTSCLLGGDDANMAFNESVTLSFAGPLNRRALEYAFENLIARHESLRSAFSIKYNQLCIYKQLPFKMVFEDLSNRQVPDLQHKVDQIIERHTRCLFDLVNGPLFKACLVKVNDTEHHLVITAHHIICDGWSLAIILQDLGNLYSTYVQNTPAHTITAELFSTYARKQLNFSQSTSYKNIEKFWLTQYSDNVPTLNLPTDFARPQIRTYKSNRLDYTLNNDAFASIKKTGIKAGCTLVTTLLAAFEVFLFKLTGQHDIVVGVPAAGQSIANKYRLVGHCVNLLPLRSKPSGDITFTEYLTKRKPVIADCYEHQQITFGTLLNKLRIPRDPSRIPLVPVIFNIEMGMDEGVNFHGLIFDLKNNPRAYENFDLFLNMSDRRYSLVLEWSYNTQLFTAETIGKMMDGLENVFKAIAADPGILLGNIALATGSTELNTLNEVKSVNSKNSNSEPLHELISAVAMQFPEKVAVMFREEEMTYRELGERSNRLAHFLVDRGIGTGDFVGVALDRSPDMLVTLLAIMKTGAAYIPLDPDFPKDRISFILEDASAKLLITSKEYDKQFAAHEGVMFIEGALAASASYPVTSPGVIVSPADVIYLIYTSGSTGRPKGVLIEHSSVVNFLGSMSRFPGFSAVDVLLAVTTISFDISGLELFLPLITGGSVVLSTADEARDGEILTELINTRKVTVMQATPATWKMMLSCGWKNAEGIKMLIGGEAIKEDIKEALAKIGELYNLYGPTETTIWSVAKKLEVAEKVLIGKPIENTVIYITGQQMQLVEDGTEGEICIGGAGVARGYWNRPDLTAEKFLNDPFNPIPGSRIYRTGDIGKRLPGGNIECLGRLDDQVKIRGYRIEVGEIENILESIPGIKEAIVVCRENNFNEPTLVAFIVTGNDYKIGKEGLPASAPYSKLNGAKTSMGHTSTVLSNEQREHWRKLAGLKLPVYMIPAHFEILPSMPLTPNGKVNRKAMPVISYGTIAPAKAVDNGSSKNEKVIGRIWTDLLNLKNISPTDNFFELGGHSLIAIEVMARIKKETGIKLPTSTLFQNSTIATLASVLDNPAYRPEWKSLVYIKPEGSKVPLYIIHGLGLDVMFFQNIAKYMDSDQPVYGIKHKLKENDEENPETIEEMAAFYISELISQNPNGPYALIGYSAGSLIAYEMAKQLRAMNREIKMVAIIDYYVDIPRANAFLSKRMKRYSTEFFPRQFHAIRSMLLHPQYAMKFQRNYFMANYRKFMAALLPVSKRETDNTLIEKTDNEKVLDTFRAALKTYVVEAVDLKIDLFTSKVEVTYLKDRKFLGWKPFALQGIRVHKISGDHFDMILPPNCKEFAWKLQDALDNK